MNFVYPFVPNDILEDQPVDVCKSRKWKWYTAYNVYKLKSQFTNNIIPVLTKLRKYSLLLGIFCLYSPKIKNSKSSKFILLY